MEIIEEAENLCPICLGPIEKDDDVIAVTNVQVHRQCYREEHRAG
jgi:hypothetical protein